MDYYKIIEKEVNKLVDNFEEYGTILHKFERMEHYKENCDVCGEYKPCVEIVTEDGYVYECSKCYDSINDNSPVGRISLDMLESFVKDILEGLKNELEYQELMSRTSVSKQPSKLK